jgi:hypothetical protein
MTIGTLVITTAPLALVTARTEPLVTTPPGIMRRPVAAGVVDGVVDDVGVVVDDDVTPTLARGGLAASVGLGVAAEESVGVSAAVFATVVVAAVVDIVDVIEAPAANWPGVAKRAALVGVTVALLVAPAPAVGAETLAGAATNVAAPLPPTPLEMTGVGSELIEALTVASGFAYIEGGISCPVTYWAEGVGWGPVGLM